MGRLNVKANSVLKLLKTQVNSLEIPHFYSNSTCPIWVHRTKSQALIMSIRSNTQDFPNARSTTFHMHGGSHSVCKLFIRGESHCMPQITTKIHIKNLPIRKLGASWVPKLAQTQQKCHLPGYVEAQFRLKSEKWGETGLISGDWLDIESCVPQLLSQISINKNYIIAQFHNKTGQFLAANCV